MSKATFEPTELELKAAQEFLDLKARKIHPAGTFDNAGRFYLANTCDCCDVRTPSRQYPYSQMLHGRTAEHVANIYNLDVANVRKAARMLQVK